MAKSIQLNDGSVNVYPVSIALEDISSHFVYQLSDGFFNVRVWLDRVNKIVRGSVSVHNAPAFDNQTNIFLIDVGYRPNGNYGFPAALRHTDENVRLYRCVIKADGTITQQLSSNPTITGIYFTFEYPLA